MELTLIFLPILAAFFVSLLVKRRSAMEYATVAASLVVFVESVSVAIRVSANGPLTLAPIFSIDALGAILMSTIALVGLFVSFYSVFYLRREMDKGIIGFSRVRQYYMLMNLFLGAMLLAATSSNPILTWISIEATTLSTAFLISFYNKPEAMEAAWKYLIVNSVGLLLGFFGTLLYFTSLKTGAGAAVFTTWDSLLSNATHLDPVVAKAAFVFVLIGYGTKVGLVPMHTWLPDAHSKAPVPISALLSGVLLNVAFIALLRFKAITDIAVGLDYSQKLLIVFGFLSICVAAFIMLVQKNYKRLLAYSSIENMGIMAFGFGIGGLGAFAAILHMVYHSLIKSALFLSAGNIFLKYSSTKIKNVKGVLSVLPITGALFITGFLAITGTPPFGIFLTKILIMSAGIKEHLFLSIAAVFLMAVLFVGFLKQVGAMMFGERPQEMDKSKESAWLIVSPLALIAIALCLSFYVPHFMSVLLTSAVSRY